MTTAELEQTVAQHVVASAEELANLIYDDVKVALKRGDDREQVYATLRQYYESAKEHGLRRERRAAGIVLSYLDGYSSPIAALRPRLPSLKRARRVPGFTPSST